MAFIGFALLIAGGLTLVIISDAGQLVGLEQEQIGQIIPLLLILILVASGTFGRRVNFSSIFGGAVLWVGMFAVVIGGYSYRFEIIGLANRILGELTPGVAVIDENAGTAVFQKGFGNTFRMGARINGAKIIMIFDTGASAVVLTSSDAITAGIDPSTLRYDVRVQTANGVGRAASVRLDKIEIGGIVREDIRAFIAEPDALQTSLLGMSFLQTLQAYTVRNDTLELHG
ncbi:MAG: TIGR02281 family clan AA aspartic protease [Devosiaceae bacterium]|nr:TIGR02281 family clan AA aspartic protease [Devosiaceae bacterium]